MPAERVKTNSRRMRDLAVLASAPFTASTSQGMPQDSRTISELCYPPASAVYENNHNDVLADVDEDDDDNDKYYMQDEPAMNDEVEQFYAKKIQELVERKYELFLRGELVLDRKKKKKKQIKLYAIQDELYAREDELASKQNKMQNNKIQRAASSSKCPCNYVNDEDDEEEYNMRKKKRPCISVDDEDDEEEYNPKKKQRNKASSSKAVKDEDNEDSKKKNMPKKNIQPLISNDITERLKEHITHEQNGTNIMLVIQKQLFASDLAGNQNRLTMPYNQLQTIDFLTEQEREYLLTDKAEIDVPLLGPTLQMFTQPMKLVKWKINSTESYILRTGWNNFVKENKNDLKQGAMIQVWSYRKEDHNEPCFAIAVVKRAD